MNTTYVFPLSENELEEPLVKFDATRCYRIRVVCVGDCADQKFAVGAVRCGNSSEIETLSKTVSSPSEAAELMRDGFALREDASDFAHAVAYRLNETVGAGMQLVA